MKTAARRTAATGAPRNRLIHGDNLAALRDLIAPDVAHLIYLDPPFNSKRDYDLMPHGADAPNAGPGMVAFADTWKWSPAAADAFRTLTSRESQMRSSMLALRELLGDSDMLAYLAHVALRLIELPRVLRPDGSVYLHCGPNSSHYLKLLMDSVMGARSFRREIVWRSGWVSGFKTRTRNWIRNHDVILYYTADPSRFTFNKALAYKPHEPGYKRRGGGGSSRGIAVDDVWDDVELYSPWIKSFSSEKLGYATQKPLALLQRIIQVSSNPGDLVLDPYCGSGTTLHAAQLLGRSWVGIDSSGSAIQITQRRLRDSFQIEVPEERASQE